MIRITTTGPDFCVDPLALQAAQEAWAQTHHLTFPNLLDAGLLSTVARSLDQTAFGERIHRGIGVEQCARDGTALTLLQFLINDPRLFTIVTRLTGVGPVRSFEGRIYRQIPGTAHHDSWHDDLGRTRSLALSINLGTQAHEGGVLQIRERDSARILAEVVNTTPGGAVLFCIAPHLEHRITPVTGSIPKTAFAGWFRREPDFRDVVAGRARF